MEKLKITILSVSCLLILSACGVQQKENSKEEIGYYRIIERWEDDKSESSIEYTDNYTQISENNVISMQDNMHTFTEDELEDLIRLRQQMNDERMDGQGWRNTKP